MPGLVKSAPIPQTVMVEPGPWLPDVPVPMNKSIVDSLNLVPQSNGLYGPERDAETFFTQDTSAFANAQKVHGSFHSQVSISATSPRFYVGTLGNASGESRIISRPEQGAWEDLSRSGAYTTTANNPWRFANFGENILAGNRAVQLQISEEGGSNAFADIPNAPQFADFATVDGFVMGVNYIDSSFGEGSQPFKVAWGAAGFASLPVSTELPEGGWPEPGTDFATSVRSGNFLLVGGGELRRVIPGIGGAHAIVVADRKMWRVNNIGPPSVFRFDEIESDAGTSAPDTIAVYNEQFIYLGHNDFYFFDGQNATPLGQGKMVEFFLNDISLSADFGRQAAMSAAIDAVNKCYVLSYRSSSATTERNDRILRLNLHTGQWSVGEQAVDALGNLDNDASTTDAPQLFAMGTDFEVKRFIGDTLAADITLADTYNTDLSYSQIHDFMPLVDTNEVTVQARVRDQLDQDYQTTAFKGLNQEGMAPFDTDSISGRFYGCRLNIPAGVEWTNFQGGVYRVSPASTGARSGLGAPST